MDLRIKNSLIVVGTLMIGIIIGFLISGRLTEMRMENMRQNFMERGMERQLMKVLKPSPEQMQELRPILDKYAEIRKESLIEHRQSQKQIFSDFEEELKPHLSQEQFLRLQQLKEKNIERFQGFRENRGGQGKRHQKGRQD